MANAIELAKSYVPKLDEVYKLASLTAMLDGASDLARQGANANELIIPMMTMDGLADYSRNSGYVQGDVTLTNETVKCNFDRGRRFTVDTMDDLETAGLAFGRLSAEFIRTKVVPELDAFRFAAYCGKTGVTKVEGALADGSAVLQALRENHLTERHARALLRLPDEEERLRVIGLIVQGEWTVAKTEQYIDARLAPKVPQRRELGTFVLRDVRVFLNSIDHQLDLVRAAGVSASRDRQETDREIVLTIRIPKSNPPAAG